MDTALPKRLALIVAMVALCLHLYQGLALATEFSLGWLLWALVPYAVSLVVLARSRSGVPALSGVSVALALDLVAHYDVFVHPTSSTAALAMIFVPFWSTLLFCPVAILLAWLVVRRRRNLRQHAL